MRIAFASDHAGSALKSALVQAAAGDGHTCVNLGVDDRNPIDYPTMAAKLANAMQNDAMDDDAIERGVLVCGSGIGISIAANRFRHIRCALVHDVTTARLCREHNDANVAAMGERLIGTTTAIDCLTVFLATGFEGGRHRRRVEMLADG